ncbi:hypothetical protein EV401DRAFT_1891873 [Pisolithus croceorrhizus]|nr:hypothetical protein EV401DRAFT_1891873 [Pisolithus croceorrhizus]
MFTPTAAPATATIMTEVQGMLSAVNQVIPDSIFMLARAMQFVSSLSAYHLQQRSTYLSNVPPQKDCRGSYGWVCIERQQVMGIPELGGKNKRSLYHKVLVTKY